MKTRQAWPGLKALCGCGVNLNMLTPVGTLYAALEYDPEIVPFWGNEALNSTRKHAACTNGVRTKDSDFWTVMIPRNEAFFGLTVKMIPITHRSII
jgi:hypothetical protein